MVLAFFFVEDKTNDDLAKEDEEFRKYLVEHGKGMTLVHF